MRLTAKAIHEVQFKETSRGSKGYHQREVDDFLDQAESDYREFEESLAAADQRVQQAEAALRAAESRSSEPGAVSADIEDNTDELRRTLILAQRTADAAIREAREEASRMVAEAEAKTGRQISEADTEAKRLVTDADARARQLVDDAERAATERRYEAQEKLTAEIAALQSSREELRAEMDVLNRHAEEQRQQLSTAVAGLQKMLEDPKAFRASEAPLARDITVPTFTEEAAAVLPVAPASSPTGRTEPSPAASDDKGIWGPPDAGAGAEAGAPPLFETEATPAPPVEATPAPPVEAAAAAAAAAAGAGAGASNGSAEPKPEGGEWESLRPAENDAVVDLSADAERGHEGDVDDGPPTQAVPELLGDADEDAFLAELRKAMTDDEPLGPRDGPVDPAGSRSWSEEPDRPRPRFGRRR